MCNFTNRLFLITTLLCAIQAQIIDKPVIFNKSDSIFLKKTNESVVFWCSVLGNPRPTITWFKNNKPLHLEENRILLHQNNESLSILFTKYEDQGTYKCHTSNEFGNDIFQYILNINDKPTENNIWVYFVILLLSLIIVFVVYSNRNQLQILKKELVFNCNSQYEISSVLSYNANSYIEEDIIDSISHDIHLKFPRSNIQLGVLIDSGEFGDVFKADLIKNDIKTVVAVKNIKLNIDTYFKKSIVSELKIKAHLGRHLNLVNLLGVCTESVNKEVMIIVEYCCYGNIQQYLLQQRGNFVNQITLDDILDYDIQTILNNDNHYGVADKISTFKCNDNATICRSFGCSVINEVEPAKNINSVSEKTTTKPLYTYDLICWSWQVARGMEYLASKKIIHGNLATRNILLADNNIVKIGNFGLVNKMYISKLFKKKPDEVFLLVKRMAIESLRDRVFSTESDVWAFGIVLWEIFSLADSPYKKIPACDLLDKLINGYRMEQPKYASFKLYSTMLDCWEKYPLKRPSFLNLSKRLSDLLLNSTKSYYIDLYADNERMNDINSLTRMTNLPTMAERNI